MNLLVRDMHDTFEKYTNLEMGSTQKEHAS